MKPLTLGLFAVPEAVPVLRRALREHAAGPCPDLQLCVSELLTNVIRHLGEGTPVTLGVARTADDRIRVEVTDPDGSGRPVVRRAGEGQESGRGLALLAAVAMRWGVTPVPGGGKTVWCELRVP
ncbi:ATP-binding protein [Streptomyces sp. NPDC006879]|uniref:ATP-binding protein n=1 Tax=Streptomyces sp. NPDC006879 TaxID=3364767 RepID=UPI003688F9EF